MKEKLAGVLRWPWNVVIYVLLVLVLRVFAIPIILVLVWVQQKNDPHGVSDGYCLSRTRKRLTRMIWALLMLAASAAMLYMLTVGLKLDRTYWENSDYATLAFCGIGGALLLVGGIWMGYTAIRDVFFPEKSALAQSIRSQLRYPGRAPSARELFAMVDGDLKENGRWFGPVGIGREWVLGDTAVQISRIRGIFTVDEIHQHSTKTGTRTSRTLELVLIDDRWYKTAISFRDPQELKAAADCLSLQVPDARRGVNGAYVSFLNLSERERDRFERDFNQSQSSRRQGETAPEAAPQDMILRQADGQVTSRVTQALVEEQLRTCLERGEGYFSLTPSRPVEKSGQTLQALCVCVAEGKPWLLAELPGCPGYGPAKAVDEGTARRALSAWLRHEAPDTSAWEKRRMFTSGAGQEPAAKDKKSRARLSLVYASGAAENHTTFTPEDVQLAAEGIVDGTYQLVDLTHPEGYLWIRVTAGDKGCTVEATLPEGPQLGFYSAGMAPQQAAAWLTGYPSKPFLPGGPGWKKIKEP